MLVLGRKKKSQVTPVINDDVCLFSEKERKLNCVVTNKEEMLNAEVAKLVLPKNMIRDSIKSSIVGCDVYCIRIENPKKPVYNTWASRVMGRTIYGNAVLISDAALTVEYIQNWYRRGAVDMSKTAGWGSIIRKLRDDPVGFTESDTVIMKREQERATHERERLKQEALIRAKRAEETQILQEYEELICNNMARYSTYKSYGMDVTEDADEEEYIKYNETFDISPDDSTPNRHSRCNSIMNTTPFPTPIITPVVPTQSSDLVQRFSQFKLG
jgi:hypothetical protein